MTTNTVVVETTGESLGTMSLDGKRLSAEGSIAISMVDAARRRGLSDAEIWDYFGGWSNGYIGVREQEPTTAAGGLSGAELEHFNQLHKRDRKGRFADKIGDAIKSGVTGALDEFTREQLRRYATKDRGLVLPRGASVDVIKDRLLKSAGNQVTGAVPLEAPALPDRAGLGRMKIADLRELAKAHNIRVPSKAKKADIVDLLAGPAEVPGVPDGGLNQEIEKQAVKPSVAKAAAVPHSRGAPGLLTMFPPEGQETTLEGNREIFDAVSKAIGGKYAGGFNVEVTRADHLGGGAGYESNPRGFLSFGGRITADGRDVGYFRRFITYTRDQDPVTGEFVGDWHWAAHHDKMVLDPQVQGAGFARDFNANWYDWYRRSGIEYVDLGAGESVGGYAWATQGFDFKTQTGMRAFILGVETPEEEFSGSSANLDWDRMPGWTYEKQQAQEPLLNAVEERVRNGEWVSAYELSQLGRQPGEGKEDWWIGKAMMLGGSWTGRMAL